METLVGKARHALMALSKQRKNGVEPARFKETQRPDSKTPRLAESRGQGKPCPYETPDVRTDCERGACTKAQVARGAQFPAIWAAAQRGTQ